MASDLNFVVYLCEQADLGPALSFRKMFGEYALYLDGQVVAFVCDNMLFVKPTEAGRRLLGADVSEHPPYPGGKPHLRIGDGIDDRPLLQRLLRVTAAALPPPKRKPPKTKQPQSAAKKR